MTFRILLPYRLNCASAQTTVSHYGVNQCFINRTLLLLLKGRLIFSTGTNMGPMTSRSQNGAFITTAADIRNVLQAVL